jgi:hypothetical protein
LENEDETFDVTHEIREIAEIADERQASAVEIVNQAAESDFVFFFDKTKSIFQGHEPDPSALRKNSDRWIAEFDGAIFKEWYHLNSIGHQKLGQELSSFFSILDVKPGTFEKGGTIDMAFVVDTTGSMGSTIASVRNNLNSIVDKLATSTNDYRVAVVSYKDFPSRCSGDYAGRVDQDFTNDLSLIQAGISSLIARGGCDRNETVFSGINAALDLVWTPGATMIMIVIGDAPALVESSGAEPITGLSAAQLIAKSIALDPVAITAADTGSLGPSIKIVTQATGGQVVASSNVVSTISGTIESAVIKPFAWLGIALSGAVGKPITFDASGSHDPKGEGIVLFEWDFTGDGVFDSSTTEPSTNFTYSDAFDGVVVLRVTSVSGQTSLGSARIVVNEDGFVQQTDAACPVDADGFAIIIDDNGIMLNCIPDKLPSQDLPGVKEVVEVEPDCKFGIPFICTLFNIICQWIDNFLALFSI